MKRASSKVTRDTQGVGLNLPRAVRARSGPVAQSGVQSWKQDPRGSCMCSVGFVLNSGPNVTSSQNWNSPEGPF